MLLNKNITLTVTLKTRVKTKHRVVHIYHNLTKKIADFSGRCLRAEIQQKYIHKCMQSFVQTRIIVMPASLGSKLITMHEHWIWNPVAFSNLGFLVSAIYVNHCILTHGAALLLFTLFHERASLGIRELFGSLNLRLPSYESARLYMTHIQCPYNKCSQKGH